MTKKKLLSKTVLQKRNLANSIKWKGVKNKRQGEIYQWVKKEQYKEKVLPKIDWGYRPEPSPKEKETYAQTRYQTWKLNKTERNYILKETARLYREELETKRGQLLWYQEQAGFTKPNFKRIIKKQKIKGIFYQKGEHKTGRQKTKTLKQIWSEKVLQRKGTIKGAEVEKLTKELFYASPRRLRDKFVVTTKHRKKSTSINDFYQSFVKKNPFPATQPYYRKALSDFLSQTGTQGEKVSQAEIEREKLIDKHGNITFTSENSRKGYKVVLSSNQPGKGYEIYKNVPSLESNIKKNLHEKAQKQIFQQKATSQELNYFLNKQDLTLCSFELHENANCQQNQRTSHPWCLICAKMGPRHPPILRSYCPYSYTYKKSSCGVRQDPDANLQWHFSLTGSRTQVAGNDWGGCHIGIFSKPKQKRKSRRWK